MKLNQLPSHVVAEQRRRGRHAGSANSFSAAASFFKSSCAMPRTPPPRARRGGDREPAPLPVGAVQNRSERLSTESAVVLRLLAVIHLRRLLIAGHGTIETAAAYLNVAQHFRRPGPFGSLLFS